MPWQALPEQVSFEVHDWLLLARGFVPATGDQPVPFRSGRQA
ncbi:MAG: hypothetical protein U1F43_35655 [Myxococcota bacterium]